MQLFKHKCEFCKKGEEEGEVLTDKLLGVYFTEKYHYHYHCLVDVINEHEKYSNKEVDLALDIVDARKQRQDRDRLEKARRKKHIKEAQALLSKDEL